MSRKSARYGQNFLTDPIYANRIVETLPEHPHAVLEVGPGPGILTAVLIDQGFPAQKIWAVELDASLAETLHCRWPELNLSCGDILKQDISSLGVPLPFYLLSNLPYEISRPFFDLMIDWSDHLIGATIMVQKEFADKISLRDRSCAQGIMLARLFTIKRHFAVPSGAFRPTPKVDSTVLTLTPKGENTRVEEIGLYYRFLKTCFSAPRKTLHNNLKNGWTSDHLAQALIHCGASPNARAEEMDAGIFMKLWEALSHLKSPPRNA